VVLARHLPAGFCFRLHPLDVRLSRETIDEVRYYSLTI
jgi:hypothetical protein